MLFLEKIFQLLHQRIEEDPKLHREIEEVDFTDHDDWRYRKIYVDNEDTTDGKTTEILRKD